MRTTALCLAVVALPVAAAFADPPQIGYASATGYLKQDSRPTLYQPLNLLDGREATAWCSTSADPLKDTLTFGFKGPVRIDEVRVYTGNGFDDATFKEFSRARKLLIKSPAGAQVVTVSDQRGQQAVQLKPALEGAQFTVEIQDLFPADDPEAPVCVTDLVFYQDGKPLNGSWLTHQLKYDRAQAGLLGTWFAGSEGAPDKFLSFYFDGTWRFVYEPWGEPQNRKILEGDYDAAAARLALDAEGKGKKTQLKLHRETGRNPSGHAMHTLQLDGAAPEMLRATFRDRM